MPARTSLAVALTLFALLAAGSALADPPAAGQQATLPHNLQDAGGYNWDVQPNGRIGDGSSDAYDGAARLQVNGGAFPDVGQGILSEDGREIWIGPTQIGPVTVTRRIRAGADGSYARFIDELKNTTNQSIAVNVTVTTDMGSDSDTTVFYTSSGDPELDEEDWGFITDDGNGGGRDPAVVHVYGSEGSTLPQASANQGSDQINYTFQAFNLEAGQTRLVAYLESQNAARDAAQSFIDTLDTAAIFSDLSPVERGQLVNFHVGGAGRMTELPVTRDPFHDTVAMASGDTLFGDVEASDLSIQTAFGDVKVPAKEVAGYALDPLGVETDLLLRVGGDLYRGKLQLKTVSMRLSSGQNLQIQPGKLRSVGFRLRDDEPGPDANKDKTQITLDSGDRLWGGVQAQEIELETPYGRITVPAAEAASLDLRGDAAPLHRVVLYSGDQFTGSLLNHDFTLLLTDGTQVTVPRDLLAKVQFPARIPAGSEDSTVPASSPKDKDDDKDVDDGEPGFSGEDGEPKPAKDTKAAVEAEPSDMPEVTLTNGDHFHSYLADTQLTVATPYGQVEIAPAGFREIAFAPDRWRWVTVTLWDGAQVSGRLEGEGLHFQPPAGPPLTLYPVYVAKITLAEPEIPSHVREMFEKLILQLGDPSWEVREAAQDKLKKAGAPILPILRDHADNPDTEIRARIEKLLLEIGE